MSRRVVVLGASGHAKVVIDVLRTTGHDVVACLAPSGGEQLVGVPVLDEETALPGFLTEEDLLGFVAIGDNATRSRVAARLRAGGMRLTNAVSPSAYVASDVVLGTGVLVAPNAAINTGSTVGDDAIVNTGATVDHDNTIGAGAHIAPGTHLAGTVQVGERAFVGVGSSVIPGISIGDDAFVGAGSVVIRDVPASATAWGHPAQERVADDD